MSKTTIIATGDSFMTRRLPETDTMDLNRFGRSFLNTMFVSAIWRSRPMTKKAFPLPFLAAHGRWPSLKYWMI